MCWGEREDKGILEGRLPSCAISSSVVPFTALALLVSQNGPTRLRGFSCHWNQMTSLMVGACHMAITT